MNDIKNAKLGDSFFNKKDNKYYYFDSLNWVLPLAFIYRNYKGNISERNIIPSSSFYGVTEFHKTPQWFMHGWDVEKKAWRDFAYVDIQKFL